VAASFGNVPRGVYAPGNVKLRPIMPSKNSQDLDAARTHDSQCEARSDLVFHGGSRPRHNEFDPRKAVGHTGVFKMKHRHTTTCSSPSRTRRRPGRRGSARLQVIRSIPTPTPEAPYSHLRSAQMVRAGELRPVIAAALEEAMKDRRLDRARPWCGLNGRAGECIMSKIAGTKSARARSSSTMGGLWIR